MAYKAYRRASYENITRRHKHLSHSNVREISRENAAKVSPDETERTFFTSQQAIGAK